MESNLVGTSYVYALKQQRELLPCAVFLEKHPTMPKQYSLYFYNLYHAEALITISDKGKFKKK